jgi:hypothetical protein
MTDKIEEQLESCLRMTEALLDAMDAAVRSSAPDDVWKFPSYRTFLQKSNDIVIMVKAIEPMIAPVDIFDMEKVPSLGDTIPMQQQSYFETARANLQILRAYLANRVEPKQRRVIGIADFLQAHLRRAMLHLPERERDIQDAIEQLLIGRGLEKGLDYDREVGRVKVSSKEVIPDFILPPLETAIEVKLLKDQRHVGPLIDEINADIQAYLQGYKAVIFVVYDLSVIRDELEFRRDLEITDGIKVIVVKH